MFFWSPSQHSEVKRKGFLVEHIVAELMPDDIEKKELIKNLVKDGVILDKIL